MEQKQDKIKKIVPNFTTNKIFIEFVFVLSSVSGSKAIDSEKNKTKATHR